MPVRRVVHLKNNVGTRFDQFRLTRPKNFRGLPRSISDQKIAGERTRVRLLLCLYLRRREKNSRLLSAEPLRTRLTHERNNVMHHHPSRRPHRSEEHTSELQSPCNLVCRLLLEKKKK